MERRFISSLALAISTGIMAACISLEVYAEQMIQFNLEEYPSNKFDVTQANYRFGDIDIDVIHARYKLADTREGYDHKYDSEDRALPFCSSWALMRKKGNLISSIHEESRDLHGGSGGLYVPRSQPSPKYFLIVIGEDNYGGRIALIKKTGDIIEFPGGRYSISKADNLLITDYDDESEYEVTIFDLSKGRVLFRKKFDETFIHHWYRKDGEFFFTESEWLPNNLGRPSEKPGVINVVDFRGNRIVKKEVPVSFWSAAHKLGEDFNPDHYESCNSKMVEVRQ